MQTDEDRYFYHGQSMRGTFRPGDSLIAEPVALAEIRPGDVIVYRKPGPQEGSKVVHRVMKVVPGGLILRGDNNPAEDVTVVLEEDIIGRVTHVQGGSRTRKVHGGQAGLWRARWLHAWNPARRVLRWWGWKILYHAGHYPYRWLRRSGLIAHLWRPAITRIQLMSDSGPVVKFVCGNRTVAQWWPEYRRFRCRKPYDLILRPEDFLAASTDYPATVPAADAALSQPGE